MVYDDFIVPKGYTYNLTGVFSNDLMYDPGAATTAYWEIRSGVISAGNGGTLLYSGDGADTLTPTGRYEPVIPGVFNVYEYTNLVSVSVSLGAGTYWLAVAPDVSNQNSYITTTSGTNAVGSPPGNDGNSFASSTFFGLNFVPTSDPSIEGPGTWDYSMGVIGTAVARTFQLDVGTGWVGCIGGVRLDRALDPLLNRSQRRGRLRRPSHRATARGCRGFLIRS